MAHDKLRSLHTTLVDAREGYAKAIEKNEDPALASHLAAADQLHRAAHADIHRMLSEQGEMPDDEGSFMGTVHRTVIAARSAIVGLDEGALDSFASGERNTINAYDEAIRDETDPAVKRTLEGHRSRLVDAVRRMEASARAA